MKRRAGKIAGLLAAVATLLLAAGMVPAAADPPQDIKSAKPRENAELHRAPEEVVVTFSEEARDDTSITVKACDRTVSNADTTVSGDKASVSLKGEPRGRYRVSVSYTVITEPEPEPSETATPGTPSPEPTETPPPDEQTKKWNYSFKVHFGPDCDGSGGNHGNKKKYSWGSTNDTSHHGGHHAASPSNPITAGSTTHSDHTGSPTSPTTYSPSYTPFYNSPSSTTDHDTHSAIPDFDSGFGDSAFESTEDSQLSDPTDPSLATPEPEVIAPEEADDEQSLSAAPTDTLEPESGVLVVALAAALLLGAGGGLFLRKADPTPTRK